MGKNHFDKPRICLHCQFPRWYVQPTLNRSFLIVFVAEKIGKNSLFLFFSLRSNIKYIFLPAAFLTASERCWIHFDTVLGTVGRRRYHAVSFQLPSVIVSQLQLCELLVPRHSRQKHTLIVVSLVVIMLALRLTDRRKSF